MGDLTVGASMNVNGACLTVIAHDKSHFTVDLSKETLRRTNLGTLKPGDLVNLERALAVGGRLGGHIVQGHVDGTGTIDTVTSEQDDLLIKISAPSEIMCHIVEKGFIAVDGTSLTVVDCGTHGFTIAVIPYTRQNTILSVNLPKDEVNLEVDILAKYVAKNRAGLSSNMKGSL